jgi:hypothetical protein
MKLLPFLILPLTAYADDPLAGRWSLNFHKSPGETPRNRNSPASAERHVPLTELLLE